MKKRVLVVGSGGIGKRHIDAFHASGRAVVSIAEPHAERRTEAAALPGVVAAYAGLDAAPLDQFDLAVICAPAHLHIALARQCLDARLPFLLEKPLAVSLDGVEALLADVRAAALPARVAYVRRAAREYRELKRQFTAGRIGDLRMIYGNVSQDYTKYRPDFRTIYYAREATGGGALLDAATHFFDLLVWLCGAPQTVFCMADRLALEGVECEDCALITLRFPNRVLAHVSVNQFQKPNTQQIELIGSKGNLMLDLAGLRFTDNDSGTWESHPFDPPGTPPPDARRRLYGPQAEAMLDALEGKPSPLCTLDEAAISLRIALAAKASNRTGTPQPL